MKQYLDLVKNIKENGTLKGAARENMPGTLSLFGPQMDDFNLQDGFPAITTKKLYWKGVVVELLWFLRGDTNIKYLDDNNVRKMWHQDSYNFYNKMCERAGFSHGYDYEMYLKIITDSKSKDDLIDDNIPEIWNYRIGDCGNQYGKTFRNLTNITYWMNGNRPMIEEERTDQFKDLVKGLIKTPLARRHIISNWIPQFKDNVALEWCHAIAQWNCRPLTKTERVRYYLDNFYSVAPFQDKFLEDNNVPKYYLDCKMYQRSCDVALGLPINIASYSLLTHILCKLCNMIPGIYTHTLGDVHIYEDHLESINEQIKNEPLKLPTIDINTKNWDIGKEEFENYKSKDWDNFFANNVKIEDFKLNNYQSHKKIDFNLSTGMKK